MSLAKEDLVAPNTEYWRRILEDVDDPWIHQEVAQQAPNETLGQNDDVQECANDTCIKLTAHVRRVYVEHGGNL